MKTFIALISIALMISCQRSTGPDPSFKTIMIRSVGEVETVPDEATFHISLNCLEPSVKAAKNCLVAKSNELIDKLRSLGIQKDDILTTSVNLDRSYTWRNNSNVFEGYRSSTSIIVTIKNMESLDEVYTELLENRNLELGGLSYSHSKIDSLENEAYAQALKKSGVLADKLLTTLPEDKKEVLKIGNVEITSSVPEGRGAAKTVAMEQDGMAGNQFMRINTGTVKINATLFVEYQIK